MLYNPDLECEKLVSSVRRITEIRGMSQTALARAAEMSESALSDLLNNKSRPNLYTLFKLCNALDVTVSDLLSLESGEMMALTEDEKELLLTYRSLPDDKDSLAHLFLDMLRQYSENGNILKY